MARSRQPLEVDREKVEEGLEFLETMSEDANVAGDERARQRATLILELYQGADLASAAETAKLTEATAKKWVASFNAGGWTALLTVMAPRGGDFLARYDIGLWAETLALEYLSSCRSHSPLQYGTSKSEPFTSMAAFRQHSEAEFRLQAWSAGGRWKRPDLLVLPKAELRKLHKGTPPPDLKLLDNTACKPFVKKATAAIEVETSLWDVDKATVANIGLSFTVKEEDLASLRNWVTANEVPLFIFQVFYDCAYALPFTTLEEVIALPSGDERRVEAKKDPTTEKVTYMVPLSEGVELGSIAEPKVEGKLFKADNGKVFVYGCLTGSKITGSGTTRYELAAGTLEGGE